VYIKIISEKKKDTFDGSLQNPRQATLWLWKKWHIYYISDSNITNDI